MACILNYSQTLEMLQEPCLLRKRDRNLNLWYVRKCKMWIVTKMVQVFVNKSTTSHSFDFRTEINNFNCRCCHALKNLGIVFSIDICTRHRMIYKNINLNICAHTWHSVSVMGHMQGFELAVLAIIIINCFTNSDTAIFCVS